MQLKRFFLLYLLRTFKIGRFLKSTLFMTLIMFGLILVSFYLLNNFSLSGVDPVVFITTFLIVFAASFSANGFLLFFILPAQNLNARNGDRFLPCELRYRWNDEAIEISGKYQETFYLWDEMLEIREFDKFFALKVTATKLVVLPKSTFDNPQIESLRAIAARRK